MRSVEKLGVIGCIVLGALPLAGRAQEEPVRPVEASHYELGLELWREGNPGEALRHFMTATTEPEVSFYAARQIARMGEYALPVLYKGLWHPEGAAQIQSAVLLGWIGDRSSVEPLLNRMRFPDAPIETEYALQKIGGLTGEELLTLFDRRDLSNAALLDRKVASLSRLAGALRIPLDPVPLLDLVNRIETEKADELEQQPRGHLSNARIGLLRFLAERGVSKAAAPLVRAFTVGADEANTVIAEALIGMGTPAVAPLAGRFRDVEDTSLRALLGVVHYLASGGLELSASGPISIILNEAQSDPALMRRVAAQAAGLSRGPNALLDWLRYHPDAEVRRSLAPEGPSRDVIQSRPGLLPYFLEKTRDPETAVAARHIDVLGRYLPNREVESRLEQILSSPEELAALRRAALEAAARYGGSRLLTRLLERREDPLRVEAVELSADRSDPEVLLAVLALLREPEPTDAKRAAMRVAAEVWRRPEAVAPLMDMLRTGDSLWWEAARGLAALGAPGAEDYFVALVDSGRAVDPEEAGALYFAFTGLPARLEGTSPGTYRFVPLDLQNVPPADEVLVVLSEKSDYRGWIKVEELWESRRSFRLDEGERKLTLYDREAYDKVTAGAGVVLLEDTVRQTVLDVLEVSELREQKVHVASSLPVYPLAGLVGDGLRLLHQGRWVTLGVSEDVREERGRSGWGRSALVHLGLFERDRIRFDPNPPPSGWRRGEPQPVAPQSR